MFSLTLSDFFCGYLVIMNVTLPPGRHVNVCRSIKNGTLDAFDYVHAEKHNRALREMDSVE